MIYISRTIATVLTLRDNMSGGLLKVSGNVKKMSKEMQKATKQSVAMINKMKKGIQDISGKALKIGGAGALAGLGLAGKLGFGEGLNMEGYRVQLITAVKDTDKASQLMRNAIKIANETPFEGGEVVEATSKLEMMGISSSKYLRDIADMSGATNKSMVQATEAMVDANVGEFERLKEFGIRKDEIMLASAKKYGQGVVFDAKGHMLDSVKMMDTLQGIMQQKYKGGAEKLANTTRGMWSTITGITKSALAKIIGVQEDGTIKQGSLLDNVKGKVKELGDTLQRWQQDGTLDKIASKATENFSKLWDVLSKVIGFMVEHKTSVEAFAITFGSLAIAIKIVTGIASALKALEIAIVLCNGALEMTPVGWIISIVAGIIIGIYLLIKNWDYLSAKSKELGSSIANTWQYIKNVVSGFISIVASYVQNKIDYIHDYVTNKFEYIKNSVSNILNAIVSTVMNMLSPMISFSLYFWGTIKTNFINFISWIINKVQYLGNALYNGFIFMTNIVKTILYPFAKSFEIMFKLVLATVVLCSYKMYQFVMNIVNSIVGFFKWLGSEIVSAMTYAFNTVYNVVAPIISAIVDWAVNKWNYCYNSVSSAVQYICNSVVQAFTNIYNSVVSFMSPIISSIVEGWNNIWSNTVNLWTSICSSVSGFVSSIYNSCVSGFNSVKDGVIGIFTSMKDSVVSVFDGIIDSVKSVINNGIGMVNGFIGGVNKMVEKANGVPGVSIGKIGEIPKLALGTQYFSGGSAVINDRRGGELVDLPSGAKVIPADKTDKILGGNKGINVNVVVQGNIIGNEEYANELGSIITNKIKLAMINTSGAV